MFAQKLISLHFAQQFILLSKVPSLFFLLTLIFSKLFLINLLSFHHLVRLFHFLFLYFLPVPQFFSFGQFILFIFDLKCFCVHLTFRLLQVYFQFFYFHFLLIIHINLQFFPLYLMFFVILTLPKFVCLLIFTLN